MITPRGRKVALDAIDDVNALVLEPFEPRGDAGEELFALLRVIRAAAGDLDVDTAERAA